MKGKIALRCAIVALFASSAAWAQTPPEVRTEIPELSAFHSVIFPLWHTAWPKQDMALLRELQPKLKEHVTALQNASLPGILREKQAKWDEGVKTVAAASLALEQALAAGQQQVALDAVERLHSSYAVLVRLSQPAMKEFDAYHQILYQVYHKDWPDKKLDALKVNAAELMTRCQALQNAVVPKWLTGKEATLKSGVVTLCASTTGLVEASTKTDVAAIGKAVDKVHSDYQAVQKLIE